MAKNQVCIALALTALVASTLGAATAGEASDDFVVEIAFDKASASSSLVSTNGRACWLTKSGKRVCLTCLAPQVAQCGDVESEFVCKCVAREAQ